MALADVALVWDGNTLTADVGVEANDLVLDTGLRTAVELSLFTDRRAEDSDALPTSDPDRRGWWADATPVVEGDKYGSKLWLLSREKQAQTSLPKFERFAREALQWLVDDQVAERVEVTAEFPRAGMWGLLVEIFRPKSDPVRFRFDGTWNDSAPRPLVDLPRPVITTLDGVPFVELDGDVMVTRTKGY